MYELVLGLQLGTGRGGVLAGAVSIGMFVGLEMMFRLFFRDATQQRMCLCTA